MSHSESKAQAAAAAAAEMAQEILFAEARAIDVTYTKYFAAGMVGLVALFTIVNWVQIIFNKYGSRSNTFARAAAAISRPLRRPLKGLTIGGFAILPSRLALAAAYFGINLALMFTQINWTVQVIFAKRCGWLTLCNLCLAVFLGLKNTPLSPLAGRSYESINVLHRCCGYTTILLMILHSTIYVSGLAKVHYLGLMMMPGQYAAAVAAICLLCTGVAATRFIRKRQYEIFYIVHVTLAIGILIAVLFHVKHINWSAIAIVIVAASMWFADRSIRFSRWIYYGYGNYCTLMPLPEGATRVVMHRPLKAQPGSHSFLWIPGVHTFQTHPFTLVSTNPAEFVISAQDGFTRDLHNLAQKEPRAMRRAAIEGPYGKVPNTADFHKVLLIAGGSGATFTLALAMDWMRKNKYSRNTRTLEFVWTVRNRDYLSWFEADLNELCSSPNVDVKIHMTRKKILKSEISTPVLAAPSPLEDDREKALSSDWDAAALKQCFKSGSVEHGRPNIDALMNIALDGVPQDCRVLVAASGPSSLLCSARSATKGAMARGSPNVQLHLEAFDW